MSAVLQTAYQLPEDLQMKAVMEMEETIFIWKKSLTQSLPTTDDHSSVKNEFVFTLNPDK